MSKLDLAHSVKKRYDILAEDLVGKDENVDCPECGKECEGRESLIQHNSQAKEHPDNPTSDSDAGWSYVRKDEVYNKIANDSSFDRTTVKRLISVASIPEQFQAFVKIPQERSIKEEDKASDMVGYKQPCHSLSRAKKLLNNL